MKRIIMHWTGGGHIVSALDRKHYHEIVSGKGERIAGDKLPEANSTTRDGHYTAHTRGLNTGSIGLAMAAMAGAEYRPFNPGKFPITKEQLRIFVFVVAEHADLYGIPGARDTILTHAEVQPTLGVRQNGKGDVCCLPGMEGRGLPVQVGDRLRLMVSAQLEQVAPRAQRRGTAARFLRGLAERL